MQPTERQQPPETGGGLTSKIGPLPVWGWLGIATVGAVVVFLWLRNRNAATTAAAGSTTPTVSPSTSDVANLQDQLATVNSQIRDLQGGGSTPNTGSSPYSFLPGGAYLFGLVNDTNPAGPGGIYVGIPHVGWAWAPNPAALSPYLNAHHPTQLGNLTMDQANATFGPQKSWTEISTTNV